MAGRDTPEGPNGAGETSRPPWSTATVSLLAGAAVLVVVVTALVTVLVRRDSAGYRVATGGASTTTVAGSAGSTTTSTTPSTSAPRPTLAVTQPVSGTTVVPGPITVVVAASGDTSTIDTVVLLVDGAGAGTASTVGEPLSAILAAGSHTVAVKAVLRDGSEVVSEAATVTAAEPTTTTTRPPGPRGIDRNGLGVQGLEPVHLGMTVAEAKAATGLPYEPSKCGNGGSLLDGDDRVFLSPGRDGRIAVISVSTPRYATISGARIGDSGDRVRSLYADKGRLETKTSPYPDAYLLVYTSTDPTDAPNEVVFWVTRGTVTSISASAGTAGEDELC